MINLRFILFVILLLSLISGCTNRRDRIAYSPEDIFLDYSVSANNNDSSVIVLMKFVDQFSLDPMKIPYPGNVQFDGQPVQPDSARIGGYYYEIYIPLDNFAGKHTITYTDINNKVYQNEFEFKPLKLISILPDTIDGNELKIEFDSIGKEDRIAVIYRDTSNFKDDFRVNARPGQSDIWLRRADFEEVLDGPIEFELVRESRFPLKSAPEAQGMLTITTTIQKESFLKKLP